tara:strand:+ start:1501 stop:1641 length:141 start_codon:yes stop_codon:yes gene_type:complete
MFCLFGKKVITENINNKTGIDDAIKKELIEKTSNSTRKYMNKAIQK